MSIKTHLTLDPTANLPPTRDAQPPAKKSLPPPKSTCLQPASATGHKNAKIHFIGTATTILEWEGIRLMTDPNFLHAGDHVHYGPGVTGTRRTNPSVDLHDLPRVDVVLLSHHHADHFDQQVESNLRRSLPIITTPHAYSHLTAKGPTESFTSVHALDCFESALLSLALTPPHFQRKPIIKVTGMPGKHVPPGPCHILSKANELFSAIPPTSGWMLELGYEKEGGKEEIGYRIYISGDTLMVDELSEIPKWLGGRAVDLMLVHLGGTTIPSSTLPLVTLTMDAAQGVQLMHLVKPELTIPIHYDDYDVFLSPLDDFKKEVVKAQLDGKVAYLDRGDAYHFEVRGGKKHSSEVHKKTD